MAEQGLDVRRSVSLLGKDDMSFKQLGNIISKRQLVFRDGVDCRLHVSTADVMLQSHSAYDPKFPNRPYFQFVVDVDSIEVIDSDGLPFGIVRGDMSDHSEGLSFEANYELSDMEYGILAAKKGLGHAGFSCPLSLRHGMPVAFEGPCDFAILPLETDGDVTPVVWFEPAFDDVPQISSEKVVGGLNIAQMFDDYVEEQKDNSGEVRSLDGVLEIDDEFWTSVGRNFMGLDEEAEQEVVEAVEATGQLEDEEEAAVRAEEDVEEIETKQFVERTHDLVNERVAEDEQRRKTSELSEEARLAIMRAREHGTYDDVIENLIGSGQAVEKVADVEAKREAERSVGPNLVSFSLADEHEVAAEPSDDVQALEEEESVGTEHDQEAVEAPEDDVFTEFGDLFLEPDAEIDVSIEAESAKPPIETIETVSQPDATEIDEPVEQVVEIASDEAVSAEASSDDGLWQSLWDEDDLLTADVDSTIDVEEKADVADDSSVDDIGHKDVEVELSFEGVGLDDVAVEVESSSVDQVKRRDQQRVDDHQHHEDALESLTEAAGNEAETGLDRDVDWDGFVQEQNVSESAFDDMLFDEVGSGEEETSQDVSSGDSVDWDSFVSDQMMGASDDRDDDFGFEQAAEADQEHVDEQQRREDALDSQKRTREERQARRMPNSFVRSDLSYGRGY